MGITMGVVFRPENIYTTVWCLYYMQGTLYPEGSVISRVLMGVFLLMSIYYFLKVLSFKRNHPVIKAFQYLAIMFGVYGLLRLGDATQEWKRVMMRQHILNCTKCLSYQFCILLFCKNR